MEVLSVIPVLRPCRTGGRPRRASEARTVRPSLPPFVFAPVLLRLALDRGHVKGFRDQDSRECSLLSTRENHPDRGSLSLWPERRPILVFKNKAAVRAYRKRIEDTFVSLACNRADLTTFSIDEANDRSSCGARRARRARRPGWTRGLLATLFFLRGDLFPFAGCESQHEENGE